MKRMLLAAVTFAATLTVAHAQTQTTISEKDR